MKLYLGLNILAHLLFLPAASGENGGPAKPKLSRWEYLSKLIDEEEKTINMVKRKTDHLMYRLFELKTERVKLRKEKENKAFLDINSGKKKISRQEAFKNTLSQYESTRAYGLSLLKKHPNTRYIAAVYHTLALNSRDYAYDKRELGYLYQAIKHARKHSEIWHMSMTSLAEYFYNEKKYKRAVSLYQQVISNTEDEWHTKNLYNYGWCLLKTHKFNQAINRLEEGYKLSFDTKYVDFREQIMHSLVSFYVIGKQIDRGVKFVMKNDKNPYEALYRFARKTSEKGFFSETQNLVELARKNFDQGKEAEQLADLTLFQFDFYNQYKKEAPLFKAAKTLTTIVLTDYQREEAIRKLSAKAREEQIIVKKDFDKVSASYDVAKLNSLKSYFDFLSILDSKNEAMYRFFAAETFYSVKEYKHALAFYKKALEIQLKTPSKMDLNRKIINGLFSSIDFADFSKEEEKNELIYAYSKYLGLWPSDKKANKIHQKLFAIYLSREDHENMELALSHYMQNFPGDIKEQRRLFRNRLDLTIKASDTFLLANLVKKMQKGHLGFLKDETKKAEVILANLLFAKFQELSQKGKTKKAVAGYKEVFYNNHYPQSVKAEAGFNIGILHTDLSESAKSVKWFKRSFPLFSESEQKVKRVFLEKMAKRSALLQDFLNAAHIQRMVLENFCKTKKKNEENFLQAVSFDLANDYILKAFHTFKTYRSCVEDAKKTEIALLQHLYRNAHERDFLSFVSDYKLAAVHKDLVADSLEKLYWRYFENDSKRKLYGTELAKLKDQSLQQILAGGEKFKTFQKKFQAFFQEPIVLGEFFDPETFNQDLGKRIQDFAGLIKKTKKLLEIGNAPLSMHVYEQVTVSLEEFANEIQSYHPQGMPKEFNQQFSKQMSAVAENFRAQARSNVDTLNKFAHKYEVLSPRPRPGLSGDHVLDMIDLRMPASEMANTFDLEIR